MILRREGHTINKKRTRRLWGDEGLRRPVPCKRKRTRPPGGGPLLRATRPNPVGAVDFQFDETADRRRIKLCNIVDEFTREALAIRVARNCTADDVVTEIEQLVAERGAPTHLRMDNGPELIAWALRDWCQLHDTITSYIEPGSPWENPFVESFNGRVRDELLNIEEFGTLIEARILTEGWRVEYEPFLMTIDACYTITGRGTVIAGEVRHGRCQGGRHREDRSRRHNRSRSMQRRRDDPRASATAGLLALGVLLPDLERFEPVEGDYLTVPDS